MEGGTGNNRAPETFRLLPKYLPTTPAKKTTSVYFTVPRNVMKLRLIQNVTQISVNIVVDFSHNVKSQLVLRHRHFAAAMDWHGTEIVGKNPEF